MWGKKPCSLCLVSVMYVAASWEGVVGWLCQGRWAGGEMIGDRRDRRIERRSWFCYVSFVPSIPWQRHVGFKVPRRLCWRLLSVVLPVPPSPHKHLIHYIYFVFLTFHFWSLWHCWNHYHSITDININVLFNNLENACNIKIEKLMLKPINYWCIGKTNTYRP